MMQIMRTCLTLSLLLAVMVISGCRGQTSRQPPVHLNPNMDNQQRFDPQEPNDFFPDGRAMRPQVAGTIAQGSLHEDPHMYQGRNSDGSYAVELPSGIEMNDALLARGQERYDIFCAPCHDKAGNGKGIIVERGMMPPPNFHGERVRAFPIGQIYEVINEGVRIMPSYANQIAVEDRWAIVAYVRALQLSRNADKSDVPADVRNEKGW